MNIQGLPESGSLDDLTDMELLTVCQKVLGLMNDRDRLWMAMPQAPQNDGEWPQDPNWTPPASS